MSSFKSHNRKIHNVVKPTKSDLWIPLIVHANIPGIVVIFPAGFEEIFNESIGAASEAMPPLCIV
jgi:hypothetical protein